MTAPSLIYVDHTHCGRHVTGLERITLELFSAEALAPLALTIVGSGSVKEMIFQQTLGLPWRLARERSAILVCPGFPPSPLATCFGARVLPYIHDTFLITRSADLNTRAKLYMAPSFRLALRKLKRFLVNSETTGEDVRRFCGLGAEVILYRPGVRNVFDLNVNDRAERPTSLTQLRFVALGTVEPRKNLLAAAAIIDVLRKRFFSEATLDIVGRPGWGGDADKLSQAPGVTLHGYQSSPRVRALVHDADFLITTSHDEGLGLPLLEGQYAGLPVVAPEKPVFREVLGESGLFIDPSNPQGSAEKIAAIVRSEGWRRRFVDLDATNLHRWGNLAETDHSQFIDLLSRLSSGDAKRC